MHKGITTGVILFFLFTLAATQQCFSKHTIIGELAKKRLEVLDSLLRKELDAIFLNSSFNNCDNKTNINCTKIVQTLNFHKELPFNIGTSACNYHHAVHWADFNNFVNLFAIIGKYGQSAFITSLYTPMIPRNITFTLNHAEFSLLEKTENSFKSLNFPYDLKYRVTIKDKKIRYSITMTF